MSRRDTHPAVGPAADSRASLRVTFPAQARRLFSEGLPGRVSVPEGRPDNSQAFQHLVSETPTSRPDGTAEPLAQPPREFADVMASQPFARDATPCSVGPGVETPGQSRSTLLDILLWRRIWVAPRPTGRRVRSKQSRRATARLVGAMARLATSADAKACNHPAGCTGLSLPESWETPSYLLLFKHRACLNTYAISGRFIIGIVPAVRSVMT